MVPLTKTWEALGFPGIPETRAQVAPGRDWFDTLSDAEQRRTMGKAKWAAWKAGRINWDDLSAEHDDDVYGTMRVEASPCGTYSETMLMSSTRPHVDDENFQQPQLPDNERCCQCRKLLDHMGGAAWWRGRWYCLPCFGR